MRKLHSSAPRPWHVAQNLRIPASVKAKLPRCFDHQIKMKTQVKYTAQYCNDWYSFHAIWKVTNSLELCDRHWNGTILYFTAAAAVEGSRRTMYWDQQYIVTSHSILAFLYVQCSGEFTLNTMISPAAFALYSSLLQSNSVHCNAFQCISTLQCIAVSEAGDWWGLGWITIKIVTATIAQSYYHRHRHHALKGQTLDDLVETTRERSPETAWDLSVFYPPLFNTSLALEVILTCVFPLREFCSEVMGI